MIPTLSISLALLPLASETAPQGVLPAGGDPLPMFIRDCSLGCRRDETGIVVCEDTQTAANRDLRFYFTAAVDIASVSTATFSLIDVQTGGSAAGSLFLDPNDPRVLIFRPSLSFDSDGNPIFGLRQHGTYFLRIPGTLTDAPPYLVSAAGIPNATPLFCTFLVRGVDDLVPGPPSVEVFVDVETIDPKTGEVVILPDVPAQGATNVSPTTAITFRFDDVMNPATVANPFLEQLVGISVAVDRDGDLTDASDRERISGSAVLVISLATGTTTVTFFPQQPLPRCRLTCPAVVLQFSSRISDLAGNRLANPDPVVFETAP